MFTPLRVSFNSTNGAASPWLVVWETYAATTSGVLWSLNPTGPKNSCHDHSGFPLCTLHWQFLVRHHLLGLHHIGSRLWQLHQAVLAPGLLQQRATLGAQVTMILAGVQLHLNIPTFVPRVPCPVNGQCLWRSCENRQISIPRRSSLGQVGSPWPGTLTSSRLDTSSYRMRERKHGCAIGLLVHGMPPLCRPSYSKRYVTVCHSALG